MSATAYLGQNRTLAHGWRPVAAHDLAQFMAPHSFEWFATFTFRDPVHPEHADKAYRVWLNKLNNHLYGRKWRDREPYGVKWCRALEWQKRGVIHYHALLCGVRGAIAWDWSLVWSEQMGEGFAQVVQLPQEQEAAKAYVCKYVTKGGELDYSRNFGQALAVDWISALT